MRRLPLIAAAIWLASPAMAGETILFKQPPSRLEACETRLRSMADLMAQVKARLTPAAIAPASDPPTPRAKPAARAKPAKPKACPVLKGRQKCKPGRTQSPKHKCKCGVWP
jgi:hypothetical protein